LYQLAPILLFAYKRLDTLKKTVAALQANVLARESQLFIFLDAAKNVDDISVVNDVRNYICTITGFAKVHIEVAEKNKGLANSIILGVSEVLKTNDKVIVLEDDLITTPNFLCFMNQALETYKSEHAVFSISGYSFNLGNDDDNSFDAYFLNRGWSWGWATWKDKWENVDWEVKGYNKFRTNRKEKSEFSKGGSDLNKMLRQQMQGKLDSWAIRWFYHQFKVGGLTLYPKYSKVYNNGFDALATHTNGSNKRYLPLIDTIYSIDFAFPSNIHIDYYYQVKFQRKMGIFSRVKSKIETLLQFSR
jgi:hypothetical protein